MLALSPLLSYIFTQVIAFFVHYHIKPTYYAKSHKPSSFSLPITFCSEQYGAFYHCIMLRHWFIVMRSFGLYYSHHPHWHSRKYNSSTNLIQAKASNFKLRPAPNYSHLCTMLIIYLILNHLQ